MDSRPRVLTWLRLALVISLLGPALLLLYVGWVTYAEAIDAAKGRTTRLAQIVQEQSQRIVETNEVISRAILTHVKGRSNAQLRLEGQALHLKLKAWTAGLQQLQAVWIWDEKGHPIATNLRPEPPASLDVSDREYFIWAKGTTSTGWYVSEPLRSRTTGQVFFDFNKRLSADDGSFQGVISVSLLTEYYDKYFSEQLETEPGFTLSLIRSDGSYISRYPGADSTQTPRLGPGSRLMARMTAETSSGEVEGTSTLDGEFRYVAFRRVGDLPLYAVASATRSVLLQPWLQSMALLTAFTLPLALSLAGLCWFAMRRVRREHAIALAHAEQYEQRLKAEDALRQAQKMEALGRLTGGVAHDFNNLLMVVQTSVALARQLEARQQPVGKALAPIERAVANGAQLTRQLLAIVRRQPLQLRTIDLNDVVPPLAQLIASTLGRSIEVSHEVAARLMVTLDQAELELALINLCVNAKDAMPSGGRLRIEAHETPPPADVAPLTPWVRLSVTDTGEGIPAEALARVTEPFFTTKPLGKGTGLGLSQVQAFVTQAGGRLEIQSELGRGTQVAILLPCTIAEPQVEKTEAAPLKQLQGSVLLVEDNEDIGQAVSEILLHAGATVTWHTSADAALQALSRGLKVDAVLSDVSLPGEHSGIDLAQHLAATKPALRVVLMTGYTDRLQEAVAAGFRVIPKPATPESLIEALSAAPQTLASAPERPVHDR